MTSQPDWYAPESAPGPPRLLPPALTILAQFTSEEALLDQDDIASLTGCSRSISKRCLVTLSDLGYLIETTDGAYRAPSAEPDAMETGHDGDGTMDTAA